MELPEQVRRLARQFDPKGLLPYEIVFGLPKHRECPLVAAERGWADELQILSSRPYFALPSFEARMWRACTTLGRALEVHDCAERMLQDDTQMSRLKSRFQSEGWLANNRLEASDESKEHVYYVSGGFVVSEILGCGEWGDIDVWQRPRADRQGIIKFTSGRCPYPTNVMLVSDVHQHIMTFDMDICKCAIECVYKDGQTRYRFLLTQSCALAWMHGCAHMVSYHPAGILLSRLGRRMAKYKERQLDVGRPLEDRAISKLTSYWPAGAYKQGKAYWILSAKAGSISSVTFTLLGKMSAALQCLSKWEKDIPRSKPWLLYPCAPEVDLKACEFHQRRGAAWPLHCLTGPSSVVAFSNSMKIWSNFVLPEWLMSRRHLHECEVIRDMSMSLPRILQEDGRSRFIIECAFPAFSLTMIKDWRTHEQESPYGVNGSIYVDTGATESILASMFCISTYRICEACESDRVQPLACSGWAEF